MDFRYNKIIPLPWLQTLGGIWTITQPVCDKTKASVSNHVSTSTKPHNLKWSENVFVYRSTYGML